MRNAQSRPESFGGAGPEVGGDTGGRPVVSLLTDFGTDEHYVGVIKGVILAINREAQIVDITHAVPAYDIQAGGLLLSNAYHYFPKGTIHLAVVDPGVGGDRQGVLVATENYYFVGPDNGLFTFVYEDPLYLWTRRLEEVDYFLEKVSTTFHGRDVFAPAAGYLSTGERAEDFGPIVAEPVRLEGARAEVGPDGEIAGEVVYVDHFGNLITNIDTTVFWLGESRAGEEDEELVPVIDAAGKIIRGISEFYQSVPKGEAGAQLNSWSRLEIFVPEGNARQTLGIGRGAPVTVRFERPKVE